MIIRVKSLIVGRGGSSIFERSSVIIVGGIEERSERGDAIFERSSVIVGSIGSGLVKVKLFEKIGR